MKTHIEEVKRLWPNIRRAKGEFVVKCLGVSFDAFRQEVWVGPIIYFLKRDTFEWLQLRNRA